MSGCIPPTYAANASKMLARLEHNSSTVNLVSTPHPRWPFPQTPSPPVTLLRVSVLDSSFNPPTLAHLALSHSCVPNEPEYDARILLLSIRNADKSLKPTDATHLQRLEMMCLLAQDIDSSPPSKNIAIAVVDEPTFVGKSKSLLSFLRTHMQTISTDPLPSIQLTFLQGLDTLERLFSPRYYPSDAFMHAALTDFFSPTGDNSRVVCAWRGPKKGMEEATLHLSTLAREFIASGRVILIDIGEEEREMSSTEVREKRAIGHDGWRHMVSARMARFVEEQGLYSQL